MYDLSHETRPVKHNVSSNMSKRLLVLKYRSLTLEVNVSIIYLDK